MSIRRTALIGVVAASAAAAGLTALALTATASQASTDTAPNAAGKAAFGKAWVFEATTTQSFDVDNGAAGPSVGDRFVFSDNLTLWGKDKKVGTDGGECVLVNVVKDDGKPKDATMQCTATLSLKGGQVTVQGLVKWSEKVHHVAVTGGTGIYTGATGTMDVEEKSEKVAKLTLKLSRAGHHAGFMERADSDDWPTPSGVGGGGTGGTAGPAR